MMMFGGMMQSRLMKMGVALVLTAPLTLADFRYEQTSRMTGGAMMGMMKMAAKFGKNPLNPMDSTVAVKGNQLVTNNAGKSATIYDLDKETITEIDFEKREYSVTTFAEMRAYMEKAMAKVGKSDTKMDIEVKETGRSETVAGMKAAEFLMIMNVEANNPQTGKPAQMRMEMSNWVAPKISGYNEIANFYKRMSEKADMSAMYGGMQQGGMGKGMAEAMKKMATMDGIPVLQIVRMIPTDPEQIKQMEQMQQAMQAQGDVQMPNAGQAAEQAAGQAAAGAVAGRLGRIGGLGGLGGGGGFGGLRRKKKDEAPPPPPPAPEAAAAAPQPAGVQGSFSSDVSMMEMTIESRNHSNSAVDGAMFSVPGGFKQVKSSMQK
jgi:hypothetical protein